MRYPYSHTVRDPKLGDTVIAYIDCEVELSVELDGGEPIISVDAIYVDDFNLFQGNAISRLVAAEIANAAEDDEDLVGRAIEDEGIFYRGRGANDPDGHFVRKAWF